MLRRVTEIRVHTMDTESIVRARSFPNLSVSLRKICPFARTFAIHVADDTTMAFLGAPLTAVTTPTQSIVPVSYTPTTIVSPADNRVRGFLVSSLQEG